jgi:transmembrane 9 superfamily protein 2/4
LEIEDFVPTLLYFAYSALMSLAFFLFTAMVGFYASYSFVTRIYGAVKID